MTPRRDARCRARRGARRWLAAVWLLAPLAARAEPPRKFALAVFHFNIQYVAGGSIGFLPTAQSLGSWELSAEDVEDQIVRESFEPVLDLLIAHPSWGVDIELQGYFLDVLDARHPGVLDKLRKLATSGQIEVVSFHYSDQLFLAFPSEEWSRSQALTKATFDRVGIPLGTSVFCQEGQAGVGMAAAMAARGYRTMIWPTNLWGYQHTTDAGAPWYRFGGRDDVVLIIGGRGVHYTGAGGPVDTTWTFLDDGELLATGGIDPYFPPVFKYQPDAVAEYASQLAALESQGYAITTVQKFVTALGELGVPAAEPPPLIDGTWQPQSTDGIKRWLGGVGLWASAERDNEVRTLQAMAHRELVTAETAASAAGTAADGSDARVALDAAWRLLSLGEVSDSSGINPYRGEIEYGIANATEALRVARSVIRDAKNALGRKSVVIDSGAGTVSAPAASTAPTVIDPLLSLSIDAPGREVTETWTEEGAGTRRVTIAFGPVTSGSDRTLSVKFPGDEGDIVYSPGLAEGSTLALARGDFEFEHFQMALANGLLGLGAQRFVIEDQAKVHVAATIRRDDGNATFSDETLPPDQGATWSFLVIDGTPEVALAAADRLNVHPLLVR